MTPGRMNTIRLHLSNLWYYHYWFTAHIVTFIADFGGYFYV